MRLRARNARTGSSPTEGLMERLGTPVTERLQAAATQLYKWPDAAQANA